MNKSSSEKLNIVIKYTCVGVAAVGVICAFVDGFAYRFHEGLGSIVSLGASPETLRSAFMEGAKKGGLYGGLAGGFFGCLFGSSVAMFGKTGK